jgi:hypothetical protein
MTSVVLRAKRHFQRAPGQSYARRGRAGIVILFQAPATQQMAAQALARREPSQKRPNGVAALSKGIAIACAPRLVIPLLGGL